MVDQIGKLVCPNDCSTNGVCNEGQCKCYSSYFGADCSHTKFTPPKNATLPDNGLCKTSKRACRKINIFGYFESEIVYVKLEEFEITDLGIKRALSVDILQATYISYTVLGVNFPTTTRRKRSSSGYTYGRGFYISLSYDEVNFSESMPVIIYNDACYSCNASSLECNIMSTCETSTTNGIQSTTVDGQSADQFPNTPQSRPSEDTKEIPLALIIGLCITSVFILGIVSCILLYLKLKPTTQLGPAIYYIKSTATECGKPPIQHYETLKYDRNHSPPPDYESLSPSVKETFKATSDRKPNPASDLVFSFR